MRVRLKPGVDTIRIHGMYAARRRMGGMVQIWSIIRYSTGTPPFSIVCTWTVKHISYVELTS